jgi:hypothetical protein
MSGPLSVGNRSNLPPSCAMLDFESKFGTPSMAINRQLLFPILKEDIYSMSNKNSPGITGRFSL